VIRWPQANERSGLQDVGRPEGVVAETCGWSSHLPFPARLPATHSAGLRVGALHSLPPGTAGRPTFPSRGGCIYLTIFEFSQTWAWFTLDNNKGFVLSGDASLGLNRMNRKPKITLASKVFMKVCPWITEFGNAPWLAGCVCA
jgi:hypothetical protein